MVAGIHGSAADEQGNLQPALVYSFLARGPHSVALLEPVNVDVFVANPHIEARGLVLVLLGPVPY